MDIFKRTILMILVLVLFSSNLIFADGQEEMPDPVKGKVLKILSEKTKNHDYNEEQSIKQQTIKVRVDSGKHKGEVILVENIIDEMFAYNIHVNEGDKVLLYLEENNEGEILNGYISDIARDSYLIYLVLFFVIVLILIGGVKGFKSVITLTITGFAILKVLLPLILKGYNPMILSIIVSIGVITLTLIIISGFNKKTYSAILGTSGGVLIAGVITLIMGSLASLTGLGNEEAQMLMYIPQNTDFNFKGLLFASIILGALGAVMDVSMSIASSMHEIESHNPDIDNKALVKAGMNVGKDIMGTMSNTLILAYAGGSLYLMLLFMAHDISFIEIINRDMIASEVVRALAGSIGLIFSIPITALVSGTLLRYENNKSS
ncbi:MAG: YibE/F family protein [Firmicutes bacterium]|nr:YibE/F family protein [Bacillota bacterium]